MTRSILRGGLVTLVFGALGLVIGCGGSQAVDPKQTSPVDPQIKRVQAGVTTGGGTPGKTEPPKASTSVSPN